MLYLGIILIGFGTLLIHESNRAKNSDRINLLENTLVEKNERISEQSEIINAIITGGDSYCVFDVYYFPARGNRKDVYAAVIKIKGKYSMRNVDVVIQDNIIEKGKRDTIEVLQDVIENVENNLYKAVFFKFNDLKPEGVYSELYLAQFNVEDYNGYLDFTISVVSENFSTQQRFYAFNLDKKDPMRYGIVKIDRGERSGETLHEFPTNKVFPTTAQGFPDMDKIKELIQVEKK